jgi:hypothetical protein
VVAAVAGHDLLAAGELAGQLDGVLVGLGAAVGEEEDVDVAWADLGQLGAQPGSVAMNGLAKSSVWSCSATALMTRCSPWPRFTDMSWLLKSMKRFPSGV